MEIEKILNENEIDPTKVMIINFVVNDFDVSTIKSVSIECKNSEILKIDDDVKYLNEIYFYTRSRTNINSDIYLKLPKELTFVLTINLGNDKISKIEKKFDKRDIFPNFVSNIKKNEWQKTEKIDLPISNNIEWRCGADNNNTVMLINCGKITIKKRDIESVTVISDIKPNCKLKWEEFKFWIDKKQNFLVHTLCNIDDNIYEELPNEIKFIVFIHLKNQSMKKTISRNKKNFFVGFLQKKRKSEENMSPNKKIKQDDK